MSHEQQPNSDGDFDERPMHERFLNDPAFHARCERAFALAHSEQYDDYVVAYECDKHPGVLHGSDIRVGALIRGTVVAALYLDDQQRVERDKTLAEMKEVAKTVGKICAEIVTEGTGTMRGVEPMLKLAAFVDRL